MKELSTILLCYDNAQQAQWAADAALEIAKAFGCRVVGVHGYNAAMHDGAFRIMEPVLPQRYQREEILRRQRQLHDGLIRVGMEKISLSYLRPLQERFQSEGVEFIPKVREGKNFAAINAMIREEEPSLVVMGSKGFGSGREGFIGSVCLRVLRSNGGDFLILKEPLRLASARPLRMVVCLDGSSSAVGALEGAWLLAEEFQAELHLVYVYDSALHRAVFAKLQGAALSREGFRFSGKEQERLHDEFIDRGLERVGWMVLDRAEREARSWHALPVRSLVAGFGPVQQRPQPAGLKRVLDGPVYERICEYAQEAEADMIFLGRTGRHYTQGMDMGSVAENVLRFSPCSVYISGHREFRGWKI